MNDKAKVLYDQLTKDGYALGDYDSFSNNIKDDKKRQNLYNAVSKEYDMGDYDSFSSKLLGGNGVAKAPKVQPVTTWPDGTPIEVGKPLDEVEAQAVDPLSAQRNIQNTPFQEPANLVEEYPQMVPTKPEQPQYQGSFKPEQPIDSVSPIEPDTVRQARELKEIQMKRDNEDKEADEIFKSDIIPLINDGLKAGNIEARKSIAAFRDSKTAITPSNAIERTFGLQRKVYSDTDYGKVLENVNKEIGEKYGSDGGITESVEVGSDLRSKLMKKAFDYLVEKKVPANTVEYILKNAFTGSMVGMYSQMGKSQEQLEIEAAANEAYGANWAEKGIAGAGSIILDAPAFAVTGGAGNIGAQATLKAVANQQAKSMIAKGVAETTAKEAAKRMVYANVPKMVAARVVAGSIAGGVNFAGYDAVKDVMNQAIQGEGIDLVQTAKATASGFGKGAAFGVFGSTASHLTRNLTGAAKVAGQLGSIVGEVGMFTGIGVGEQLMHGVEWDDIDLGEEVLVNAAMIGALKAKHPGAFLNGRGKVDENGRMLNNLKFTKEQISELEKAGYNVEGTLSFISKMVEGNEVSNNKVISGNESTPFFTQYEAIMNNGNISQGLKAKMMYLVEGKVTSTPPLMTSHKVEANEDGTQSLVTLDAMGRLIERKTFNTEDEAKRFAIKNDYAQKGEVNKMVVAERMNDRFVDDMYNREAIRVYCDNTATPVSFVSEIIGRHAKGEALTPEESTVLINIKRFKESSFDYLKNTSTGIAEWVKEETGINPNEAVLKRNKSQSDKEAIDMYFNRLTENIPIEKAGTGQGNWWNVASETMIENHFTQAKESGRAKATPEEKHSAKTDLDSSTAAFKHVAGDDKFESFNKMVEESGVNSTIAQMRWDMWSQPQIEAALNYYNSKQVVEGVKETIADNVQGVIKRAKLDILNNANRAEVVTKVKALTNNGLQEGYIINGFYDVVDGVLDKPDNILYFKNEEGKVLQVTPNDVKEVINHSSVDELLNITIKDIESNYGKELEDEMMYAENIPVPQKGQEINSGESSFVILDITPEGIIILDKTIYEENAGDEKRLVNAALKDGLTITADDYKELMTDIADGKVSENAAQNDVATPEEQITLSENEQEQIIEEPKIPVNEKGEQLFEQAPVENTIEALLEMNEGSTEEALSTVNAMLEGLNSQLNKANTSTPKGSSVAEIQESKTKRLQDIADISDKMNYWKGVSDQMSATVEQPVEELPTKVIKPKRPKAAPYSKEESAMGDPSTVREAILRDIATGRVKFMWGDSAKSSTRGLESHLGSKGVKERRSMFWSLSKDGMYPEQAAEYIYGNLPEQLQSNTSSIDIFNELLDVMHTMGNSRSKIFDEVRKLHGNVEQLEDEYYQEEYDRMVFNELHMTPDEYNEMDHADELRAKEDYQTTNKSEIDNIFVEPTNNDSNEILHREGIGSFDDGGQKGYVGNDSEGVRGLREEGNQVLSREGIVPQDGANAEGSIDSRGESGLRDQSNISNENLSLGKTGGAAGVDGQRIVDEVNKRIDDRVAVIDTEIANAQKSIQAEKDKLGKRVAKEAQLDMFGVPKPEDQLFESEEMPIDYSAENIQSILKPKQDKIVTLQQEKELLLSGREKAIDDAIQADKAQLKINPNEDVLDFADRIAQSKEIEAVGKEVDTNPTEAQKEAGNYKKGHIKIDGLDISIENPKGSVRSGVDADGKEWSLTLNNDYGYIRGTKGNDGDHVDVFFGNTGNKAFVVDQVNKDGSFDEHKVMYGFNSLEEAKSAYLSNYEEGWQGLGSITEVEDFKSWVKDGDKTKPYNNEAERTVSPTSTNDEDTALVGDGGSIPRSSELYLSPDGADHRSGGITENTETRTVNPRIKEKVEGAIGENQNEGHKTIQERGEIEKASIESEINTQDDAQQSPVSVNENGNNRPEKALTINPGEDVLDYAQRLSDAQEAKKASRPSFIGEPYEKTHDKTGANIHIAPIIDRVSNDVFNDIKQLAKQSGGSYSNFISGKKSRTKVGFVFKTQDQLNQFINKLSEHHGQIENDIVVQEYPANNAEEQVVNEIADFDNISLIKNEKDVFPDERSLKPENNDRGTNQEEPGRDSEQDQELGSEKREEGKQPNTRRVDRSDAGNSLTDKRRSGGTVDQPSNGSVRNIRNNRSEKGVDYAPKSPKARYDANIKAIELMQKIAERGDVATPKEMEVLRKYSGWGGLGGYFNNTNTPEAQKIRELLGEEEYDNAAMSINSAYYTPAAVVDALWGIAEKLGFKGGNILEGSAGTGNILGLMPQSISDNSNIKAVEIDPTSGLLLSQLYPDADVAIQGFENTNIKNGSIDLAVTNVPFVTGLRVHDKIDKDLSKRFKNIHDFCIAKNVRKLRPGGLGIFISSNGTLDKSTDLRQWLVTKGDADVIGAFRLHNDTFGGTNATSDIIVIRKRIGGKIFDGAIDVQSTSVVRSGNVPTDDRKYNSETYDWEYVTKPANLEINSYFVNNPESMAGDMMFGYENNDTYRPGSVGLYPNKEKDQSTMLQQWIDNMKEITEKVDKPVDVINESTIAPEGTIIINEDGALCISQGGEVISLGVNKNKVKGYEKTECVTDYNNLKAALDNVLDYQVGNPDDKGLQPLIKALNAAYDSFTSKYGSLNKNTSISFLKNDVNFPAIAALETYSESKDIDGKKTVNIGKTNVFSGRVVGYKAEPEPKTVRDGVIASIYKGNSIDLPYISEKLNMPENEIQKAIVEEGIGFVNPESGNTEVRHEYLSGNVREKLEMAKANNENGEYSKNIEALEKVIPMDIPAHLIEFSLGSSWIDADIYKDFLSDKFGMPNVTFEHIEGGWSITGLSGKYGELNRQAGVMSEMFNDVVYGDDLVNAAMNNRQISVKRIRKNYDGTQETIVDKKATEACQIRIQEIKDEFKEWARERMRSNEVLADKVMRVYNDKFNSIVPKAIDDMFLPERFEGASTAINLNPHQKRGAIRATTEPLLLAHEVGTGKTFTLITAAMEMRRLGTAKKPMIVVQNATVGQFINEVKKLYPNAKALTLTDRDRTPEGRRSFYAKIKYNDWDIIIVPQSTFEMIPDSEERQRAFIQERIEEKLHAIEAMKESDADSRLISSMEKELSKLESTLVGKKDAKGEAKAKSNAEAKAQEQLDRRVDDVQHFDEMGIDAILIDEAHEYKRLGFETAMTRGVKGIDPAGSRKAAGVYLKTRSVLERTGWKNVVFATGTPISNTAAEIWTFMRYLMPKDVLKANDIYYFDDFVRNFGNISQTLEFATNGKFKENNRFSAYINKPELIRLWASISDTVLTKEVKEVNEKVPQMENGKAQDIYLPQSDSLVDIMRAVRSRLQEFEEMTGKEKKANSHIPLTMYGIAKRAAIDVRLVDRNAADEPGSKTNKAVEETLRTLEETKAYKGTVAIFCDSQRRRDNGVVTFDLFEDIKSKLIEKGVPEDQIIIMAPGMSIPKKEKIFADVNAGNVRVIIGNTQTMGTGVNINERLHTLIHMDAPDRPMDYTQRNGRILRQGNLHKQWGKDVRVLRFGVEDSLDVTSYQRLKTKSSFIDSVMDGKGVLENNQENRILEEDEEGLFDSPVAVLSGSQYAMLKNKAERDFRKYVSKLQQYESDQTYITNKLRSNAGKIKANENLIAEHSKVIASIEQAFPTGRVNDIVLDGVKCKESTIDKVLKDVVNKRINDKVEEAKKNVSFKGGVININASLDGVDFDIKVDIDRESIWDSKIHGYRIVMHRKVSYSSSLGHEDVKVLGGSVRVAIDEILNEVVTGKEDREFIEALTSSVANMNSENELMKQREGKSFEFDKELKESESKVKEYTELMRQELAEKEAKYEDRGSDKEVDLDAGLEDEDDGSNVRYRTIESKDEHKTVIIESVVNGLSEDLNIPIITITDVNELPEGSAVRKRIEQGRNIKGWYDINTKEVFVYEPNITDSNDAKVTVLHEAVGHKGLRSMYGKDFDKELDNIYKYLPQDVKDYIKMEAEDLYNGNMSEAIEEYLSEKAEQDNKPSWWSRVLSSIKSFLRKMGLNIELSDTDLSYILFKSKRNLNNGDPIDIARDIAIKAKYEVGEFRKRDIVNKAPNGNPSNLSEKQYKQVRTQEFKNWFGDWEKATRIEKLKNSNPVEIAGTEIESSGDLKQYKKNALKYGKGLRSSYTNRDTGISISLGKSGVKEVLNHDYKDVEQLQSIAAIPQIIEESIYIDSMNNNDLTTNKDVSKYHYYVCGLNINSDNYTVRAVVAEQPNGDRYYDHKLSKIEKGSLIDSLSGITTPGFSQKGSLSTDLKDKKLFSILQTNASKVVDENGEPLVVYHGTDVVFSEFKVNDGSIGKGVYFSSSFEEAADYAAGKLGVELSDENDYGGDFIKQGYIKEAFVKILDDNNIRHSKYGDAKIFLADNPSQIKSATENNGSFDPDNNDIRFREEGERPKREEGESIRDYTKRLNEWKKDQKLRESTLMEENGYITSMADMMGVSQDEVRDILYNTKSDIDRRAAEQKRVNKIIREAEEENPGDPISHMAKKAAVSGLNMDERKAFQQMANEIGLDTTLNGLKRAWRDEIILRRRYLETSNLETSFLVNDIKNETTKKEREAIPFIIEGTYTGEVSNKLVSVVDRVSNWFDEMYDELLDNGVAYGCSKLDNYVTHIWDAGKSDKEVMQSYNNMLKMRSQYTKRRVVSSLAEGIEMGLVPKYTDITDIMQEYGQIANLTIANKRLLDFMKGVNIEIEEPLPASMSLMIPVDHIDKDYVMIDNDVLSGYKVHRSMAHRVKTIFGSGAEWRRKADEDMTLGDKTWKLYDMTGSMAKRVTLSLSFFHAGALTESAIAAMNPIHFSKTLVKNLLWDALTKRQLPTMIDRETAMDAVKHMVQLGASSDYDARDVGNLTGKIAKWAEGYKKSSPNVATSTLSLLTDIVDGVNTGLDKFLWNYLHDSLKMYTYKKYADEWRAVSEKNNYSPEVVDKGLNNIGQMINDQFGGQHWELLNITPGQLLSLKRVLLSPDWNISTVRQFLALSGKMGLYDKIDFDGIKDPTRPFQRRKATMFWITAMLFFGGLMNGINALRRDKDERAQARLADEVRKTNPEYKSPYEVKYPDGMKWYDYTMFGNGIGKTSDLFIGRNDNGSELYARWGKQFREIIELIYGSKGFDIPQNVIDKALGKANPVFNMMSIMANGQTLSGYAPEELRDEEKKNPFSKWFGRSLYTATNSFIPWSVSDLLMPDQGKDWNAVSLVMPTSKGMSNYKAKRIMEDGLISGNIGMVESAYNAALMNNLNADKLIQAAITSVDAMNKKEYRDGIKTIQDAVNAFDAEKDVVKKSAYKNKLSKMLAEEDYRTFEKDQAIEKALDYIDGVKPTDLPSIQYSKLETSDDVRSDYTISKIMNKCKGVYSKADEMIKSNNPKAKEFIQANKETVELYKMGQSIKSSIGSMKKGLGKGNDDDMMKKIREAKQFYINEAGKFQNSK